jgi:hypothetical protein
MYDLFDAINIVQYKIVSKTYLFNPVNINKYIDLI